MALEEERKDTEALETLFRRFYKPLRAYAFRFTNDPDLAEDIVQDVFFELWKRHEAIRFEDAAIQSYLFKAVEKQISKALYGLKEHLIQKGLLPLLLLATGSCPQ